MRRILLITSSIIFHFYFVNAQDKTYTSENKKAIKLFEDATLLIDYNKEYDRGIYTLQKVLELDSNFLEAHYKMAVVFETFHDYKSAYEHYLYIATVEPMNSRYVSTYRQLADINLKRGEYEEAKEYYSRIMKFKYSSRDHYAHAQKKLEDIEFALVSMEDAYVLDFKLLPRETINSHEFNSHPVLTADSRTMIFSAKGGINVSYDDDIVISEFDGSAWGKPVSISNKINSKLNESSATISGDGKVLVFTSCDKNDGKGACDLYIAHKVKGEWTEISALGSHINTKYNEIDPSLSADGNMLFFCSDKVGGLGGYDVYVSYRDDKNKWSHPMNLGNAVNSVKDEKNPFVHADSHSLYFSSNGRYGLGGFDIFKSDRRGKEWTDAYNLGFPFNTAKDEGGIFITADFSKGYVEKYVNAESDGYNHSEIYGFDVPDALKENHKCIYAQGIVRDYSTKEVIEAEVELFDLNEHVIDQRVKSDAKHGDYLIVLREGAEYGLHVKKDGYFFFSHNFDFRSDKDFDPLNLDVELIPIGSKQPITLNNIFFETASADLQNKSAVELEKLLSLMQRYGNISIEVAGHTDDIGETDANMVLSLERAKVVRQYLIDHGIENYRIRCMGYGDLKPVAENTSDEGRKLNRRIEMRVL